MALTFTSWTAYTDDDARACTLNWTDPSAIRYCTLRPHLEAIRQALVERCTASSLAVPSALNTTLALSGPSFYYVSSAIQSTITSLITRYVNHTDHSGNWENQATCAPAWTEAALLTDIAPGTTRLTPTINSLTMATWCHQQYQLLQRLIWRTWIAPLIDIKMRRTSRSSASWEEAQAVWLAETYQPLSIPGLVHIGSSALTPNGGIIHDLQRWGGKFVITDNGLLLKDFDLYTSAFNIPPPYGIDNEDASLRPECYAAPAYHLVTQLYAQTAHTTADYNLNDTPPPIMALGSGITYSRAVSVRVVSKYNIAGGFTFQ